MINAEIIADSINTSNGARLTSWLLSYPRFVHSELLTHRVFSKNSASSRAIPVEKIIKDILDNPAMPEFWGKNQSGMQAEEELDDIIKDQSVYRVRDCFGNLHKPENITKRQRAKEIWLEARNRAIGAAKELNEIGLHKQIANRILEPWFHMKVILSGTEYENFFALRAHKDAQPELQKLAYLMLDKYNQNTPKQLNVGDWHIPFGDKMNGTEINLLSLKMSQDGKFLDHPTVMMKIAIARCARVSYLNYEGKDDYAADIKLCDRLFGGNPKHLSPTEHVAQAVEDKGFIGNFRGFRQYRYFFADQNLKDDRIISKI